MRSHGDVDVVVSGNDWPSERFDLNELRAWVRGTLPGRPKVKGPTIVHRSNAWGVTARFTADDQEVVFKAGFLPVAFPGASVYELVERCARGLVPEVLAAVEEPGRRWMLFRVFVGETVGSLGDLAALADVGRTMARIQTAVAASGEAARSSLPRSGAGDLPTTYAEVLTAIRDRFAGRWLADAPAVAAEQGLPGDAVERFASARGRIARWAEEAEVWPESVLHVDLHPDNAARLPDGRTLIFDWEEGGLGYPFLVLDKLLVAADEGWGEAGTAAVRSAYLDGLPWRSRAERERGLEIGLRLSPIWYAAADLAFADALGWDASERVATWVGLALHRWDTAAD